ncbi:MAG TPA: SUMF1/EgtB/PvdO family nonheme iron enzyme, partial [Luteolibacter sp.]
NEMQAFCAWFQKAGIKAGYLTEDHEISPQVESSFEDPGLSERARKDGLKPFRLLVRQIDFGEITLTTDPPGVEIYMNAKADRDGRVSVGSTAGSLLIPKVKPGAWQLYLVREGYKPLTIELNVGEGEKISRNVTLEKSLGLVFGKPWENAFGMRFVPLDQDLMVAAWETRRRDYESFAKDTHSHAARVPDFQQTPDHPVVNVSRDDARAFCAWLTEQERKSERIAQTHVYRLPTDLEWSKMVGLQEEEGISPGWRDARKQREFPWGGSWPPDKAVGNFADLTASDAPGMSVERTIFNYNDGFAHTAPVGSFPANTLGLFDLSGNVQEWVEDDYSKLGKEPPGVLRGGGWNTFQAENLYSGSRNAVPPNSQDAIYGFRVVIAKVPPKAD